MLSLVIAIAVVLAVALLASRLQLHAESTKLAKTEQKLAERTKRLMSMCRKNVIYNFVPAFGAKELRLNVEVEENGRTKFDVSGRKQDETVVLLGKTYQLIDGKLELDEMPFTHGDILDGTTVTVSGQELKCNGAFDMSELDGKGVLASTLSLPFLMAHSCEKVLVA